MWRKGKKFHKFDPLLKQLLRCLKGHRAILDDEIVVLDAEGRSNFRDLMARRGEPRYCAFDLLWLNGRDLRRQPLLARKRRLRRLIPPNDSHLLYVEHLEGDGVRFFELVCEQDLDGVICKHQNQPLSVYLDQGQEPQLLAGCRTQGIVAQDSDPRFWVGYR